MARPKNPGTVALLLSTLVGTLFACSDEGDATPVSEKIVDNGAPPATAPIDSPSGSTQSGGATSSTTGGNSFGGMPLPTSGGSSSGGTPPDSPEQTDLRPDHLIIVGIDGLGADWTSPEFMPQLFDMATGIDGPVGALWNEEETSSSPNWAAMITGTPIPLNGVTNNSWQIGYSDLPPTIVAALHAAEPDAKVGLIQDWEHLGRLFHEDTWDWEISPMETQKEVTDEAIKLLEGEEKPRLLFLHFDDVDVDGHSFGWDSEQIYEEIADADDQIARLRDTLVSLGMWDDSVMMIVSDHGGHGEEHKDPTIPAVRRVPLMIVGGAVQESDLATGDDLRIYDIAPTVAALLGVPEPPEWVGTSRL